MAAGARSVPTRCPRCRPSFSPTVRRHDGRRTGWSPEALYVGFLLTPPYEGWRRPPVKCPECGTEMEAAHAD